MAAYYPPNLLGAVFNPSDYNDGPEFATNAALVQTNAALAETNNTVAAIESSKQNVIDSSNRLSAAFVGNGTTNDIELAYIGSVTASVQAQLAAPEDLLYVNTDTTPAMGLTSPRIILLAPKSPSGAPQITLPSVFPGVKRVKIYNITPYTASVRVSGSATGLMYNIPSASTTDSFNILPNDAVEVFSVFQGGAGGDWQWFYYLIAT